MSVDEHRSPNGLHCPICSVSLVMTERQGVEIDYCPKCRGVWLDRGELDKIIERNMMEFGARQAAAPQSSAPPRSYGYEQERAPERYDHHSEPRHGKYERHDDHSDHRYGKQDYKRKSWLQDLFD